MQSDFLNVLGLRGLIVFGLWAICSLKDTESSPDEVETQGVAINVGCGVLSEHKSSLKLIRAHSHPWSSKAFHRRLVVIRNLELTSVHASRPALYRCLVQSASHGTESAVVLSAAD